MALKARGEFIDRTDQANLIIQFRDQSGNPIDTDSFPTISIVQPSGLIFLAPTSAGVARIGVGKYSYIFTAPINAAFGVWNDVWTGFVNGFRIQQQFDFIVSHSEMPGLSIDGYVLLGEDPGFNYSQAAIKNINKLIKSLKARLNSSGKAKSTDGYGNVVYVDCDIFSIDTLVTFLATILWDFNQVPYFTFFQFDDDNFVDQFGEILVEGATLYALASMALLERGREYTVTDNGINFNIPTVSELMMTEYNALLGHYWKLKLIKNSLRSAPKGMGQI